MGIQLVVTTGTSLAESSIKIDSDLALTPDQELSNEKQIVIKVSDKSKAQRDLSLIVPAGATFDSTATEKLNQDPTYSVEFDSKDKSKQLTLKALVKNQAEMTAESKTSKSGVASASTLQSADNKDYRLVFKIENSTVLAEQNLKVKAGITPQKIESKPLFFKQLINLEKKTSQSVKPNEINLSTDHRVFTEGDTISVNVDFKNSVITTPLYIDLGSSNITNSAIEANQADRIEFEMTKDQATGNNVLKIFSNQLITNNFKLLLKTKTAENINIKVSSQSKDITSNSLALKVEENKTPQVLANNPNQFDDGITNWREIVNAVESTLTVTNNLKLAFTYGVFGGGSGISSILNPDPHGKRPNVYLIDAGKNIGAFYTSSSATKTSDNYGIVTDAAENPSDQGRKGLEMETYSQNSKGVSPTLFMGTDDSGLTVLKKVVTNPKSGYVFETLYRFSNAAPIVQQELYFKNNTSTQFNYAAYFSMDTQLNGNDRIELYAMGDNSGIYMSDTNYKLLMDMKVPDGPSSYGAMKWPSGKVFDGFSPKNINGKGIESRNLTEGTQVLGAVDSAYTAKWKYHTLNPGAVDHYRTDIGITKAPFAVPSAKKSYVNKTSQDNKNHTNDMLTFTLQAHNMGYKSTWSDVHITDQVSEDLEVDTTSFELIDNSGNKTKLPATVYDSTSRKIDVKAPNLRDNQWATVKFNAKISSHASGKTITNTVVVNGKDYSNPGKPNQSARDSIKIIVEKSELSLQKNVKNITNADEKYVEVTEGSMNDELSYQLLLSSSDPDIELNQGTVIEDVLDETLETADEVSINYLNAEGDIVETEKTKFDSDGKLTLSYSVPKAGYAVLEFKTKIIGDTGETIKNIAKATNGKSSVQSNIAKVNPPAKVIPVVQKSVRNISDNETTYSAETSGATGDDIEYRVMAINITDKPIVKGTLFNDVLDDDLIQDSPIKVEYYDVSGVVTDTEEVNLQNGKYKLTHEIPPYGDIRIYIKAEIDKTDKTVINNTAMVADGKSDVAKVNIVEKTPPTVIKEVKNLTKADDDFTLETEAEVDDQVEYRIQLVNLSSVDTKVGTVLKDVLDSDLGDIQQVKIDYLDKDENITATQTTDLTDDQVTLDHVLPAAGRGMAIAYIKAKVKETDKSVINNKASLTTEFGKGTSDNAKLNIKQSKGRIVVRYRERKDESHKLAEDETFDGKIGDTKLVQPKVIPETDGNWTVVDSSNMTNPDWGSTTKPDWTLAHDYTVTYAKDEQVITYRYEESHIGIIADKRWDFGKHDTTATDRNYYLKAKTQNDKKQPYEVGVEDYYTSKGWTLNVKQDDQFHTNANEKIGGSQKFLDNAVLNFHNGQIALKESDDIGSTAPVSKLTSEFELAPKGAAVNLMTHTNKMPDPGYYAAHGFGIWAYQFGDAQQADYSIGLKVPKATKRFPRQYTSQLTWSLVIAE